MFDHHQLLSNSIKSQQISLQNRWYNVHMVHNKLKNAKKHNLETFLRCRWTTAHMTAETYLSSSCNAFVYIGQKNWLHIKKFNLNHHG